MAATAQLVAFYRLAQCKRGGMTILYHRAPYSCTDSQLLNTPSVHHQPQHSCVLAAHRRYSIGKSSETVTPSRGVKCSLGEVRTIDDVLSRAEEEADRAFEIEMVKAENERMRIEIEKVKTEAEKEKRALKLKQKNRRKE